MMRPDKLYALVGNNRRLVNVCFPGGWKRRVMQAMYMEMVQDDRKTRLDQQIDENLRKVFRQALEEEVPERFQDLLRQLREQDRKA
jgi:hypothetical protein